MEVAVDKIVTCGGRYHRSTSLTIARRRMCSILRAKRLTKPAIQNRKLCTLEEVITISNIIILPYENMSSIIDFVSHSQTISSKRTL
jgi:hypothetical protein